MSEYIPNLKQPKAGWQRIELCTKHEAQKIQKKQEMADKKAQAKRQQIKHGIGSHLERKALDDELKDPWE